MNDLPVKMYMRNAMVRAVSIRMDPVLFALLSWDAGVVGGSFGTHTLCEPFSENGKHAGRRGTAYGCEYLRQLLLLFDCNWEKIPGKPCRVIGEGIGGTTKAIGHFVEDKWFYPHPSANKIVSLDSLKSLLAANCQCGEIIVETD